MAEGDSFGPDRYFDTGVHVPRYEESIEWLKPWLRYEGPMIVPPSPNLPMCRKLLEVGGCGVWTRMLTAAMPWVSVDGTQGDIRLGWDAKPEFDAVAFMEVMEHLWDVDPAPGEWPDEFKGTGMRNVLRSIYGSLKPGGVMLLTTPNAGSCNERTPISFLGAARRRGRHPRADEGGPGDAVAGRMESTYKRRPFATLPDEFREECGQRTTTKENIPGWWFRHAWW